MKNNQLDRVYQEITDSIIELMESSDKNWTKPWSNLINCYPENGVTGHYYQGVNVFHLSTVAFRRSYQTNLWAGMKQWNKVGCRVKAGETATLILRPFIKEIKNDDDEVVSRISLPSWNRVFNIEQISGFENNPELVQKYNKAVEAANTDRFDPTLIENNSIDQLIDQLEVRVVSDTKAYYDRAFDRIGMPPKEAFNVDSDPDRNVSRYYSTLLHELTHYTGHESRCNRQFGNKFGDKDYAFEELVAELGSAFLCNHFKVQSEVREDHASYLKHWLTMLKEDNTAIVRASSLAQTAVEYLIKPETRVKVLKAA